ncbi:MAG: hypothetical protein PVSMB4_14700 [Ktedonobacterales bacterium]
MQSRGIIPCISAHSKIPIVLLVLTALLCGACNQTSSPHSTLAQTTTAGGTPPSFGTVPHVVGAQLVDAAGQPLLLRGAMMESSFAYIKSWQGGQDPTRILNSTTFAAMRAWHMNALRTNISYWIYRLDPATYLSRLDQVVQQANAAGLYVILDFHDDKQSGSPYADGMMHAESLTFWTLVAGHYKTNPLVLFDPINEPKYPDWTTWLHGTGAGVVGFQAVINAIRATGAAQLIVLEPGSAAKAETGTGGWGGLPTSDLPQDPNLIFSKHDYGAIITGNPQTWDAEWGPVLHHYPIYYGEWAVLPDPLHVSHCQGLTSANADAAVTTFLAYLAARQANWTAWDFEPGRLIRDYTSFAPTTFQTGTAWTCGDPAAAQAGMGQDVQQFLAAHP